MKTMPIAVTLTLALSALNILAQSNPPGTGHPDRSAQQSPRQGPTGSTFVLRSPAVTGDGALPVEYTGDGTGATPPLEWSGEPAGTKSFAVLMHHLAPEGVTKWYWTLYNIPLTVHALPKNVQGVGTLGNNSVNDRVGYAPPHSKGPGPKIYILTVYALSAPVQISVPATEVNREVLLAAMKPVLLGSAELKVVYDRTAILDNAGEDRRPEPPRGPGPDEPNP
jgi:phosphatidylethanolamine-binding protein (PEBP) family uncharacterized protein